MTGDPGTADENPDRLAPSDDSARRATGGVLASIRDRPSVPVGLVIALLGYPIASVVLVLLVSPTDDGSLLLFVGPPWIATAVLVGFVLGVERRPLASIGAGWPTRSDLRLGVAATAIGLLTFLVTIPLGEALGLGSDEGTLATMVQLPLGELLLVVITAGVTEEVLFRGYPIERIVEVTGSEWAAGALTLVAFVLVHVPVWGVGHLITISGISVVLTVLYVWRRRLAPVVITHFLFNLVSFTVLPAFGLT